MTITPPQSKVVSVLRDVVETARARVARKPVKVDLVIADDTVCTVSDPEKLRQLALTALNNAVQSTERGRITVILRSEDQCLKLTVTDTGMGMPKDVPTCWNSPAAGDISKRRTGKHIQPDLVTTRKLVELLGGGMRISSKVGEGAIVEVWLPLANHRKEVTSVPLEMRVSAS